MIVMVHHPPPCQTHACAIRVQHRHWRKVVKPYEGWLAKVRRCESGGDYRAVNPSGTYTGAYQFDDVTWGSVGGRGRAKDAGHLEQDYRAVVLRLRRGTAPWPVCGR